MKRLERYRIVVAAGFALVAMSVGLSQTEQRSWLAGDSHIHSRWSPGYDRTQDPPQPIIGGDAIYPTPTNAQKALEYGLSWMVTTDHGGPNHSKINMVQAYAELRQSRESVPEILQFYGMEFNMPAMDHHTLMLPNTEDEWRVLFSIESQFDANETWPVDPARNTEESAIRALAYMKNLPRLPLMFANHPSRSATDIGKYGLDEPYEFRNNNDIAPDLYRGMEGAPGHQAGTLAQDGSQKRDASGEPAGNRGAYGSDKARTLGGFDQMTAIVGGLWDSMLGEGRRFWIVATSDSHANFADPKTPGTDFWPGQYQKTYVKARRNYDDLINGLRSGRIFVVSGDLIRELDVTAESGAAGADIGATLRVVRDSDVRVTIRFLVPTAKNAHGDAPLVQRIDLITGEVRGPATNRNQDRNETTKVVARFTSANWRCIHDTCSVTTTLPKVQHHSYLRVRGTSGDEPEPVIDARGENPWNDLWFYSNPIFVEVN